MYEVKFNNLAKTKDVSHKYSDYLMIADLERALALASLLQKISTPEVKFGDIVVQPFKLENHETQKN